VTTARRINRGRGHSYELDGAKVVGITTALNKGLPKNLKDAAVKLTGRFAVDHWDELAEVPPTERLERLIAYHRQEWSKASIRGTRIHEYAQRLAAGEELEVPEEYDGHVQSYLAFAEAWQPREVIVERPFFSRRFQYAGTPDLVADLADGRRWLLDWKTGEKGLYAEFGIQLAAARFADFYLDENDEEVPVDELAIEAAGCVSVRADGYDLVPMPADAASFRLFLIAKEVAEFLDSVKDERDRWIGEVLLPPNGGRNA
jgi:hypothetical protein